MSKRRRRLWQRCLARSNLKYGSCNWYPSVDETLCRTPPDYNIQTLAAAFNTAEVTDSDSNQQQPKRKHASVTPNTPLHEKSHYGPSYCQHSTSGSSLDSRDSGVGSSWVCSLNSTPYGSKRSSRETSSTADTTPPLVASQWSENERISIDDGSGNPYQLNDSVIIGESTNPGILNESSATDNKIDDLIQCTRRLSIAKDEVEELQIAARRLLDDMQQQQPPIDHPQSQSRQEYLNTDTKSSVQVESEGPYFSKRRHSSAGPYVPQQSRQMKRRNSAQPSLHPLTEDSKGSHRRRRPSACIVCERKHRATTMSAESVIVKTARFPDYRRRHSSSEVLKVIFNRTVRPNLHTRHILPIIPYYYMLF